MKTKYSAFIALCAMLLYSQQSMGQKDTLFWFAPPQICTAQLSFGSNLDTPVYLRITTYSQLANVTISIPANPLVVPITATIQPHSTVSIALTPLVPLLETAPPDQVLNTGLKLSSTAPISAYYDAEGIQSPEIFTLKGQTGFGTSFWIPGQNFAGNATYPPSPSNNSFDIVATQDNTAVTITPSQAITGHSAGSSFTVTLNRGQTYSAAAISQLGPGHLQGSTVTSNNPVAITVKDDLLDASIIWGNGQDLTGDQTVPLPVIGTEYIPVRGDLSSPYDAIFILATQNNTTINRDGAFLTTLNAGATYMLYMNNPSTYIQASAPVYVWQLSGQGGELGAGILPQIKCSGSNQVAYVRATPGPLNMMILVENGGQNNFLFNGSASVITAAGFAPVPGTGGQWVAGKFGISLAQLAVDSAVLITNSTNLFHLGVDNGTVGEGASFGYYSNFDSFAVIASNITLPCGAAIYLNADSFAGATYLWSGPNGYSSTAANPVISNVNAHNYGIYTVTATYNGCTATDTTTVTVPTGTQPGPFTLGGDTAYCGTFTRVLSSGVSNTVWSTGATGAQITVNAPGTYWAKDSTGCGEFTDTVVISQLQAPAPFSLGNDTAYCGAFTRVLSSGISSTVWSTGATASQITVNAPGTYWAKDSTGCGNFADTVVISRLQVPAPFSLGNDTTYCGAFTRILTGGNDSTQWSNGTTGRQITVNTAGSFWAININVCGTATDTIILGTAPIPPVVLSGDTPICNAQAIVLNATTPNATYHWQDNSTAAEYMATAPGIYSVTVTGADGCTVNESIKVINPDPIPHIDLGGDIKVCGTGGAVLNAYIPNGQYVWSNGATDSAITAYISGAYTVSVSNGCSSATASANVTVYDDGCRLLIPTGFTPNNDGVNDIFHAICHCPVRSFSMRVFDRWGLEVFSTNDIQTGWDGTYKGINQPLSVYVYTIVYYNYCEGKNVEVKGNVTLVR